MVVVFSKKIPKSVRDILLAPEHVKHVSVITFWEISLKFSLGKIELEGVLPDKLPAIAKETGFEVLNLTCETATTFYRLPKIGHKDPFDRMLTWLAIAEDFVLLTRDKDLSGYKIHGLKILS